MDGRSRANERVDLPVGENLENGSNPGEMDETNGLSTPLKHVYIACKIYLLFKKPDNIEPIFIPGPFNSCYLALKPIHFKLLACPYTSALNC